MVEAGKVVSENVSQHNRKLIFRYLLEHENVSKQELVRELDMSLPTVTRNLNALKKDGWVAEGNEVRKTGGRYAATFHAAAASRWAIGVSLTAHHMNVVAMDLKKQIHSVRRVREPFLPQEDAYRRRLGALVQEVMEAEGITASQLCGIGLAIPSLVSEDGMHSVNPAHFTVHDIHWEEIAEYIPYEGRLFHDSFSAGYAEAKALDDVQDAFYIMLGSTVGGAVITNGQISEGAAGRAGELCHMIIDRQHPKRCYCGQSGCFETVCSGGVLDELTGGNLEEYFSLLAAGDTEACGRWEQYLDDLALGVHNIRMLFNQNVILGGYIGAGMAPYLDDLCERVDALDPFQERAEDYLYICRSKVEPTAVGAAQIYIDKLIEEM